MTDNPSNVIAFPKKRQDNFEAFAGPIQTIDDVKERVDAVHSIHVDNVLDAVMTTVMHQLIVGGFDINEDESHELAFVAESIRSLMSRQYGVFHPFQELADEAMVMEDEDSPWEIADGLVVAFAHDMEILSVEDAPEETTEEIDPLPVEEEVIAS